MLQGATVRRGTCQNLQASRPKHGHLNFRLKRLSGKRLSGEKHILDVLWGVGVEARLELQILWHDGDSSIVECAQAGLFKLR